MIPAIQMNYTYALGFEEKKYTSVKPSLLESTVREKRNSHI